MSDAFLPLPQREGTTTTHRLPTATGSLDYRAVADWFPLYRGDRPVGQLFYVAYLAADAPPQRPLTVVFNGGPGASSAYLHMGALGPKRVVFHNQGQLPRSPAQVVENGETWLSFTDLVFVDPMGTGFSRPWPQPMPATPAAPGSQNQNQGQPSPQDTSARPTPPDGQEFWDVDKDLQALGDFIQGFLSREHRWLSPLFIAGESYGGYRVARLMKRLQQDLGIGLAGAVLISPALDFSLLAGNDYSLASWGMALPSMAAAALHHGQVQPAPDLPTHLQTAETFVWQTLLPVLAQGGGADTAHRAEVYQQMAALVGLDPDLIARHRGRLPTPVFARELLRSQQRILGRYDAAITAIDPFPDRLHSEGADPTLYGIQRLFAAAINSHLRHTLSITTDLPYHLLNFDVFQGWRFQPEGEFKQGYLGAVDDLRTAMALNPHTQVHISHGVYDLVTPYFASAYLVQQMHLDPELQANLTLRSYQGGHMFYTWATSRQQWLRDMGQFYAAAGLA